MTTLERLNEELEKHNELAKEFNELQTSTTTAFVKYYRSEFLKKELLKVNAEMQRLQRKLAAETAMKAIS